LKIPNWYSGEVVQKTDTILGKMTNKHWST